MFDILFIHQNFPGQFKHLAPALVKKKYRVFALSPKIKAPQLWQGVNLVPYQINRSTSPGIHPWVSDFETKIIRGEALYRKALELKSLGFQPDLVFAHPGWGESVFIKDVWPNTRLAMYFEYYYLLQGGDTDFDPEFFKTDSDISCRLRLKNLNNILHMHQADAGMSPTFWQANTFPKSFREKITVIHDGIDTNRVKPNSTAVYFLKDNKKLSRQNEVITFINRNLEPYRGYHSFMRCLPLLMTERPNAEIVIIGGFGVSYGSPAPKGQSWYQLFLNEVKSNINLERVHFLGNVPYDDYLQILQISTVHVYLSYPFVMSWSLLEAMSSECAIVASDTAPVIEVIRDMETGVLVDFFDYNQIVNRIVSLLNKPELRQKLGRNARNLIKQKFDLHDICLPRQLIWVDELMGKYF